MLLGIIEEIRWIAAKLHVPCAELFAAAFSLTFHVGSKFILKDIT